MLSPTGDAEEEYLPLRTTPTSARRALAPTGTGGVSAARPCRGGSERAVGPLALSQSCTNLFLCEKERAVARRSGAQSDAWVEKSYSRFSSANCAWEIF